MPDSHSAIADWNCEPRGRRAVGERERDGGSKFNGDRTGQNGASPVDDYNDNVTHIICLCRLLLRKKKRVYLSIMSVS